jgi:hypothetical protein
MRLSKVALRWNRLLALVLVCAMGIVVYRRFTFARAEERKAAKDMEVQRRYVDVLITELAPKDAGSGVGDFPPWYGRPMPDASRSGR